MTPPGVRARRASASIGSRFCLVGPMVIDDISAKTGICRTWTTTSLRPPLLADSR